MARKQRATLILVGILFFVTMGCLAAFLGWKIYLGDAPMVIFNNPPSHLGMATKVSLTIKNGGNPLSRIQVAILQGSKEHLLLEQSHSEKTPAKGIDLSFEVNTKKLGLTEGNATLEVRAWGRNLGSFFPGKFTRKKMNSLVDTRPPSLLPLNAIIHMSRGGSALCIYRLSEDAEKHGVMVGENFFPGYNPWSDNPLMGLCLFAYSQSQAKQTPIIAFATDRAGNMAKMPCNVKVRWKTYRHDKLNLSDRTVKILSSRFASLAPKNLTDPLDVFKWINTDYRKTVNSEIKKHAQKTFPEMLFKKTFSRPKGKPMAAFGDRRTYFYKDQIISKAVHLGVDLADVAQSPIKAVARGTINYAGPLGIYGNCIIIDHGLGLSTLYGHLSSLSVMNGDQVEKGQRIGASGATGLALGDHLHFSVLVNGVFVNPTEWWDPHWIQDNIKRRFMEAGIKPFQMKKAVDKAKKPSPKEKN